MKFLKNFIIVSVVSLAIQAVASTNAMSFESIKGMGEYTYEGKFKKKNYSTYQKKAKEKAINSAWTRYIARLPQARQITYQKLDSEFRMDLSPYIGNVEILDETHDKDLKSVQIIARVTIFNEAVDTKLNMASAVNRAGDDASYFSFIFLARQTTSIKSFDDKVVSIEAKSASADLNAQSIQTSEDNEVAKSSETVASTEANLTTKVTTGGSTERKADRISYDVSSPQDIDAAMGDILSTAGYEVVSYDDIVSECGGVEPDDIKSTTMGDTGEDIQLSPAARKKLPITIEVKRRKSSLKTVYGYLEQASNHAKGEPVVFFRSDRMPWVVMVGMDHYMELLRNWKDKDGD